MFSQTSHSTRWYSTRKLFENVSIYRMLGASVVDGQGKKGCLQWWSNFVYWHCKNLFDMVPLKITLSHSADFRGGNFLYSCSLYFSVVYKCSVYIQKTLPVFSQFGSMLKPLYSHTFRFTTFISVLAIIENQQEGRMNEQLAFIF